MGSGRKWLVVSALAALLVAGAACGTDTPATTEPTTSAPAENPAAIEDGVPYRPSIDPARFVAGVDNPYFPLVPGTTWVYEGHAKDETERIEVEVTDRTREILGVTTMVVRDRAYVDGDLVEDTYDWYAQDVDGNVWYFGEDTKEIEKGEVVSTKGSWEAGVDGAEPGIVMLAAPAPGVAYRQEFYAGEAEDQAEVVRVDQTVDVPYGSFDRVVETEDTTPLEPELVEHKFYAKGVGVVLERTISGGEPPLELIEVTGP